MKYTPEGAAQAYLRREQIRKSLSSWCEAKGFTPARHHRLLIEKLEAVARGDIRRLAVFMPPGSAKSTYTSILFPPWLLAQNPKALVLAASHTTELAERWGRRVRNHVAESALLLGISLSEDNQAANRWSLTQGGEYYAAGAGVGIAGFRALYGLIDDPIRSRQDADSLLVRDRLWDWYLNDFRPRLIPHARQVLIQCMAGDTPVLMATGEQRPLRDIRPGDHVATYENGGISTSTVRNWINHGPDRVFEIRMQSGASVKANARHPFLIEENSVRKWQRTATLKKGSTILRVIGANEKGLDAPNATGRLLAAECAPHITASADGALGYGRLQLILSQGVKRIYDIVTELILRSMNGCWQNRVVFAPSANNHLPVRTRAPIGITNFASITATTARPSGDYSATIATSQSVMERPRKSCSPSLSTYEIARDAVLEVVDAGFEDVFDVQIDRTENFIAGLCVSHNTRWHEDDLAGRALNHEPWEVLSLPALAKHDDALGRGLDEPLWCDDDYGYGAQLLTLRETTPPRVWSALYQQAPAPDEGDFFKEEWLRARDIIPHASSLRVYGGSDYAVTADGGDYTVHVVVGVDHLNNLYLLDVWRRQATSDVWIDAFCDLVQKYRPLYWAEETGQIRSGVGPFLEKRMAQRRVYVNREQFATRGDKAVRARSIQGRMALDGLYYNKNSHWVADWLAEILNFPASKHDDQVDAMSLVGQLLDKMVIGKQTAAPKVVLPKDGYKSERKLKTIDPMTL